MIYHFISGKERTDPPESGSTPKIKLYQGKEAKRRSYKNPKPGKKERKLKNDLAIQNKQKQIDLRIQIEQ